jgi:hypothetical protein
VKLEYSGNFLHLWIGVAWVKTRELVYLVYLVYSVTWSIERKYGYALRELDVSIGSVDFALPGKVSNQFVYSSKTSIYIRQQVPLAKHRY